MATEIEWNMAYNHVQEVLKEYILLIGDPRGNPSIGIAVIHIALVRYNLGDRTEELFLEMNDIG